MRTYLVLAAVALSLTACVGGGDDASNGGTTTPPPATSFGSRIMPGSVITVTPETAFIPGQPASVLISAPGLQSGATMTASLGDQRDTASPATITVLSPTRWRADMTLPDPLPPATSVLVTVTLADGSVLESGLDDFVIAR